MISKSRLIFATLLAVLFLCPPIIAGDHSTCDLGPIPIYGFTNASSFTISGIADPISDVNVLLGGIHANSPGLSELDVLLVSPGGTHKIMLTSFGCDSTTGYIYLTLDSDADRPLPAGNSGIACEDGHYLPGDYSSLAGGYILDTPPAPAPPYTTDLSVFNGTSANGLWYLYFEDYQGDDSASMSWWCLIIKTQGQLMENFSDGVLDPGWTYSPPSSWTEPGNGYLVGTRDKKATALASSFPGCLECNVEATMQTAGGIGNRLSLFGWYLDKKNNIEIMLKEETDVVLIKYRVDGVVVAKKKVHYPIDPGVSYRVLASKWSDTVGATINDDLIGLSVNTPGLPGGTVGLRAKATTGSFGYIHVWLK